MAGLVLKLKGYYYFLKANSDYKDKITLIQIIRGLFPKSSNMKNEHGEEETKQLGSEDFMMSDSIPAIKILKE